MRVPLQAHSGDPYESPLVTDGGTCRSARTFRFTIMLSADAHALYEQEFAASHTPQRYFVGPNWLLVVPNQAPRWLTTRLEALQP